MEEVTAPVGITCSLLDWDVVVASWTMADETSRLDEVGCTVVVDEVVEDVASSVDSVDEVG